MVDEDEALSTRRAPQHRTATHRHQPAVETVAQRTCRENVWWLQKHHMCAITGGDIWLIVSVIWLMGLISGSAALAKLHCKIYS